MFLVNGIRLLGQIRRFDNFTVSLSEARVRRLSISMPSRLSTQRSRSNCQTHLHSGKPALATLTWPLSSTKIALGHEGHSLAYLLLVE